MNKIHEIYCDRCKSKIRKGQKGTIEIKEKRIGNETCIEYLECENCGAKYTITVHNRGIKRLIEKTKKAKKEYDNAVISNAGHRIILLRLRAWEKARRNMNIKSNKLREKYNKLLNDTETSVPSRPEQV